MSGRGRGRPLPGVVCAALTFIYPPDLGWPSIAFLATAPIALVAALPLRLTRGLVDKLRWR